LFLIWIGLIIAFSFEPPNVAVSLCEQSPISQSYVISGIYYSVFALVSILIVFGLLFYGNSVVHYLNATVALTGFQKIQRKKSLWINISLMGSCVGVLIFQLIYLLCDFAIYDWTPLTIFLYITFVDVVGILLFSLILIISTKILVVQHSLAKIQHKFRPSAVNWNLANFKVNVSLEKKDEETGVEIDKIGKEKKVNRDNNDDNDIDNRDNDTDKKKDDDTGDDTDNDTDDDTDNDTNDDTDNDTDDDTDKKKNDHTENDTDDTDNKNDNNDDDTDNKNDDNDDDTDNKKEENTGDDSDNDTGDDTDNNENNVNDKEKEQEDDSSVLV